MLLTYKHVLLYALCLMPTSLALACSTLSQRIQSYIDEPAFKHAQWGIMLESPQNREQPIVAINPDVFFVPGSNIKVITAILALEHLPLHYRIKTSLYATNTLNKQGVLRGDLILFGQGDPTLTAYQKSNSPGTSSLEALADQLVASGLHEVRGNLIVDTRFIDAPFLGKGWEWEDLSYYYAPELSALNIDSNILRLTIHHGPKEGEGVRIESSLDLKLFDIVNTATTVAPNAVRNVQSYRGLGQNTIRIEGTLPLGDKPATRVVTMHKPHSVALKVFKDILQSKGIRVRGKLLTLEANLNDEPIFLEDPYPHLPEVAYTYSRTLEVLLEDILTNSNNFPSDLLIRHLGALKKKDTLTEEGRALRADKSALKLAKQVLDSYNIDRGSYKLFDGSGLSRYNLITPRTLNQIYIQAQKRPYAAALFSALPIMGVNGTLKARLYAPQVHAKSGTMTYHKSLAGYIILNNNELLYFSIILNNYDPREGDPTASEAIDEIVNLILMEYNSSTSKA